MKTCSEDKYWNKSQQEGAVDLNDCPCYRLCRCERCAVCGHRKHMAIHGPVYGAAPGSKPYGHRFEPEAADAIRKEFPTERPQ